MAEVGEYKTFMKLFKIPSKPTCDFFFESVFMQDPLLAMGNHF